MDRHRDPARDRLGAGAARRREGETGVAIVLQTLLLVPVLIAVALAVDVGAWYLQASDQQSAADSAALSAVVWLPDVATATSVARDTAAANGFEHGVNATVDVSVTGENDVQVAITADAPQYFSGVVSDGFVTLTRAGTARFVPSVALGSPLSAIGTGELDLGTVVTNQWASISGYCTSKEDGDRFQVGFDNTGRNGCPPPIGGGPGDAVPNTEYRTNGYWYRIDRPARQPYTVRVFDAGLCRGTITGDQVTEPFSTVYTLYGPDDSPFYRYDNPVIGSVTVPTGTGCGAWSDLFTLQGSDPLGEYFLEVRTAMPSTGEGHNNYAVWVQNNGNPTACSRLRTRDCPAITAVEDYSITINTRSAVAEFFLAEVASEHHDKRLVLELWDTADGMSTLQILDPTGTPVEFTYRTVDGRYGPAPNDLCAMGPCLDVGGTGPQPYPNTRGRATYNDRLVEITIELPDETTMESWPTDWWRISYVAGSGSVYDRTTWAARIEGDPIRLID